MSGVQRRHHKKVRNHYIARLLLNRFASRVEQKKKKKICWVWQVTKKGNPKEISTKDTALSKYFYGKSETGVEDAFGNIETRFSQILSAIDRNECPDNYHQELNFILWLFYTRTRSLRDNLGSSMERVLGLIPDIAKTVPFKDQVVKQGKQHFSDPVQIELLSQRLPLEKRALFINIMGNPSIQELMAQQIEQFISMQGSSLSEAMVAQVKKEKIIPKITKGSHNKALLKMLQEETIPSKFTPLRWEYIKSKEPTFILGDSCMFAVTQDGKTCSILRAANDWQAIYFPISSTQVLAALRDEKLTPLAFEEINRASAEVSYDYIYASRKDMLVQFSELTGTKASFLTAEESEILKENKVQEFNNQNNAS